MRRREERGAVTAELALGLPLLAAVTACLTWPLAVGVAQVQVVDAARETARAVARGDTVEQAVALGRQVAPAGAVVRVEPSGEDVVVTVTGRIDGPGGVLGTLPGADLRARAHARREPE